MLDPGINKRQGASGGLSSRPSQIPSQIRRNEGITHNELKRSSSPASNLRGMSADAAERWSKKPKPASKLRGMSADAAERWSNSANRPKPASNLRGMSADAAERWSNKPKPASNLRGMSADAAERWSNSANSRGTYNIRSGDTLSAIAQRELGSSSRWREIKKPDGSSFSASEAGRLRIGQQISLPGTSSGTNNRSGGGNPNQRGMSADAAERWSNSANSRGTYNIRSGDTLSAIAQRELGSSSRWREIKKPDGSSFSASEAGRLRIGQQISLPGTSRSTNNRTGGGNPNLRGMSADAAERWSGGTRSQKPASNLRGMSADAAERWSNKPKPASNLRGMSADAAERWNGGARSRTEAYQALYNNELNRTVLVETPRTLELELLRSSSGINSDNLAREIYMSMIPVNAAETSTTWLMDGKYGIHGAEEMLEQNKDFLKEAAEYYGIDGRAIAGAIRWEYEQNKSSRFFDEYTYNQVQETGNLDVYATDYLFNIPINTLRTNGNGWGKMHFDVAQQTLANSGENIPDNRTLARMLAYPTSAIDLIARNMQQATQIYREIAGVDISNKPEILATLYHTGDFEDKANRLKENRRSDPAKMPEVGDEMGTWVRDNLGSLQDYQTT